MNEISGKLGKCRITMSWYGTPDVTGKMDEVRSKEYFYASVAVIAPNGREAKAKVLLVAWGDKEPNYFAL